MFYPLAKALFERKLFSTDTEITADYRATAIGNIKEITVRSDFIIRSVSLQGDKIVIEGANTKDGHIRNLLTDSIIAIDGMDPNRFAEVYDIKFDGSTAAPTKRRGRKPKNRNPDGTIKSREQLAKEAKEKVA